MDDLLVIWEQEIDVEIFDSNICHKIAEDILLALENEDKE